MWKYVTRYYRRVSYTRMKMAGLVVFLAALFFPSYVKWEEPADNFFTVFLNGEQVGTVEEEAKAEELLMCARKELVADSEELVFIDVDMNVEGQAVLFGKTDEEEFVKDNMSRVLSSNIKETTKRSYAVKVNNYMVNLGSIEEVKELLQTAVSKYDPTGRYQVELLHATGREFNVLTAQIVDTAKDESLLADAIPTPNYKGGFEQDMDDIIAGAEPAGEKSFSDYELGIRNMNFSEEIEIAEVYLEESHISDVATAVEEVIKDQEVNAIYTVVAGDTLSEIAIKTNVPMDQLVAMNDALESTSTTIRVGQALIITIPEPELSVERVEENYYEEIYDFIF